MAQTREGAILTASKAIGISADEYRRKQADGLKWCSWCKEWQRLEMFGSDKSRADGFSAACYAARKAINAAKYKPVPPEQRKKMGPAPYPARDGDKIQARQRINVEVRTGKRPHPNTIPCFDCGHVWGPGERRHDYDHYLGYSAAHHLDAQSVCTTCHARRDNPKATKTKCIRGHDFTPANTFVKSNGCRQCKECRRTYDKGRRRSTPQEDR